MDSGDQLVSVPRAGEHLGVGRSQAWRLVNEGQMPATKVGKTWVVKFSDVQAMGDRRKSGRKGQP